MWQRVAFAPCVPYSCWIGKGYRNGGSAQRPAIDDLVLRHRLFADTLSDNDAGIAQFPGEHGKELSPEYLITECLYGKQTLFCFRMQTIRVIVKNDENPYLKDRAYPLGKEKYLTPSSTRKENFLTIEVFWKIEEFETDHSAIGLARRLCYHVL